MCAASLWACVSALSYKYVFVYHVGALTEALPLYICKQFFRKRTSIWTQDIWPDSVFSFGFRRTSIRARCLDYFVSAIYNSVDSIMVSSPGFVGKIGEYVSSSRKPIFIPQWAPKQIFLREIAPIVLDQGCFNFIFAGNVGTQQNLERVIRAFEMVHYKISNVRFNIVGDGRCLGKLKDLACRLDMDYIHFHSRIPQSQILSLLYASDSCVLSLNPDQNIELTLPAKFHTYLFSERPILCVARGESKSLVNLHGIGEVAEPDSIVSIAEAISRICDYSLLQKRSIAERMRSLASGLFSEKESKRKLLEGIIGFPLPGEL